MADAAPASDARVVLRRAAVPVVAALVAVFVVFTVLGLVADLPDIDWRISPGWLALAAVLFVAFQGMHGELWRRLLSAAGANIPGLDGQRIFAVSLLARYVPTQVMLAVTRLRMGQALGVARTVTLASLAYELALVLATSTILSAAFLLDRPEVEDSPLRWLLLAGPAAAVAVLHPRMVDLVARRLAARMGEDGKHATIGIPSLAGFAVGYAASFLVCGLGLYALARGLAPVGALSWSVVTAFAVGYAASILAFFIPGGLGAREAAIATALTAAMPFRVALAVAIGSRLMQTGVELAFAAVTTARGSRRAGRLP